MIAFGCAVSEPEAYHRYTSPGIERAREPDSVVFPVAAVGTIGRSYNLLLDDAARLDGLEALVIVHPHTEIADPDMCAKLREAFSDPGVAIVGCAGASGVRSIAWWEGTVSTGHITHRYNEHMGGELPGFSWTERHPAPAEVDSIDGFFIALSPWAVRELRFDEGLVHGHGFDLDLCLQARAAGRTVRTADLRVIQHRALQVISDGELWTESHIAVARKWEGSLAGRPAEEIDWRARARRAEAERESTRAVIYFRKLVFDAEVQRLEQQLRETEASLSWRVTKPLRRVNQARREWRERRSVAAG